MAPLETLDPDSSFKHWIASDLRFYREARGLSLAQMGQIMKSSRHTVSNIEHARDGWNMNEDQAGRLDAFLKLNGHFARLVRYARTAHDPDWFAEYAKHEAKALIVRTYRLSLMPGLLQTPEYARALITASRMVKDVEAAVEARMKRQEVLSRKEPPLVWVLMDENILYRPVGGAGVMRDQLARLREAIELPQVMIRIVPQSAGYHLGLEGSFNSLTLESGELAFVEAPGGGRLIQGNTEVREFGIRWDRIGACALPWESSRDLVDRAMEQF
ncbi:Scr1 family TA system antitoxin-like transcriptional regulator [Spirillospora sp. CA-253888]